MVPPLSGIGLNELLCSRESSLKKNLTVKVSSQQLSLLSEITSERGRGAERKYENQLTPEAKSETSLQRQGYLVEYLLCADTIN